MHVELQYIALPALQIVCPEGGASGKILGSEHLMENWLLFSHIINQNVGYK